MSSIVIGLVVVSAGLHLSWNLLVRRYPGNLKFVWWLTLTGGIAAAASVLILRIPIELDRVWPWLLGTIAAHAIYFTGLARSYDGGDLGAVYPATRGGGILGTTVLAWIAWDQHLSVLTLAGICMIAVLVALPAMQAHWTVRTTLWTVVVAVTVAVYSTIDNHGARLISPVVYIACQFLGAALVLTPSALREKSPLRWGPATGAGVMSVVSYLLILYAYRQASAAPVLALRQIGIAAAPLVGWLVLREPLRRHALWISLGIAVGSALLIIG
ncbi:MAG: hypothetical protein C7B45_14510 [Sulfobacillus acidophilus]|uniref:EamA domain-containing protein n=1 Tax=Sulfobacillus acidophilus TaxID=53633 RepID=A0A2T2WE85_9FIRM|nr:MAG: hypothetical protein C7B45_14510 [Sulfobacillus acidophilus]